MEKNWSVWWSSDGVPTEFEEHSDLMSEADARSFAQLKAGEADVDSVLLIRFARSSSETGRAPDLIIHL